MGVKSIHPNPSANKILTATAVFVCLASVVEGVVLTRTAPATPSASMVFAKPTLARATISAMVPFAKRANAYLVLLTKIVARARCVMVVGVSQETVRRLMIVMVRFVKTIHARLVQMTANAEVTNPAAKESVRLDARVSQIALAIRCAIPRQAYAQLV